LCCPSSGAEALHRAGDVILDQDVGFAEHFPQNCLATRRGEVQGDAALVGVQREEIKGIPIWPLAAGGAALFTDARAGPGRIARLACEFRAANLKGQLVAAGGRVTSIAEESTGTVVDVELWATADGAVLARGMATVVFT
jgi:hypothetical protein